MDAPDAPDQRFDVGRTVGRYRLRRKLGAGGMGEVWLADDDRLGRPVAIKRPSSSIAASPEMLARLQREARHAAQLAHRSIASVYDIVDEGDQSFIVMEYVDGEDLSEVLRRGPLPLAEALRLATAIADAVAAAHAHGITHRDLKPANVRVTADGQPKVLDFGISHAPHHVTAATAETVTSTFTTDARQITGTPGYSAPEQLLGHPTDARADVFSLGALTFELVTGTRAFDGGDLLSRAMATLSAPTPRATDHRGGLPPALDTLLDEAMQKAPADRLASAAEFRDRLRAIASSLSGVRPAAEAPVAVTARPAHLGARLFVLAAVVAALSVGIAMVLRRPAAPAANPTATVASGGRTVVAVLPPANLTGDAGNDVMAVGFADSLFNDLAGVASLTVVPPDEVRQETRRLGTNLRDVAHGLGAAYLVDSTIQQSGADLRVNARLVKADGSLAWRSDFDGNADRVFDLQRRVAQGVVEGLQVHLAPDARTKIGASRSHDLDALREYWKGRALLEGDLGSAERRAEATHALEAAVAKDPAFAEAHAALGEAYWAHYGYGRDPEWAAKSVAESTRAAELDPSQPRVWIALARVHNGTGQVDRALTEVRKAIELQPASDDAHRVLGEVHQRAGRVEDAAAAFDRAIALRPDYWRNHYRKGVFLSQSGRYDEAEAALRAAIALAPDVAASHQSLGAALQLKGDLEGARQQYQQVLEMRPSSSAWSNLGVILHWQGKYREAVAAYRKAADLGDREPLPHRNMGDAYWAMGDRVQARASYGVAVSLLEEGLRVDPNDVDNLVELAYCELRLGQGVSAQQHLRQAERHDPEARSVLYLKAVVAARDGRLDDALALVQRAVQRGAQVQEIEYDDDLAPVRALPAYRAWLASRSAARSSR